MLVYLLRRIAKYLNLYSIAAAVFEHPRNTILILEELVPTTVWVEFPPDAIYRKVLADNPTPSPP
jgi:hypothetical protein